MEFSQEIIVELENIIGYKFKDKNLLIAAFTHSSFANEHGVDSNEKLEFLGDSVLNLVVTTFVYDGHTPTEGEMTVTRSKIVSRKPLAAEVERLNLIKYLRLDNVNGEELSEKFHSDLYEATVGAIFKDGGYKEAMTFIRRTLLSYTKKEKVIDYKTKLQEKCQAQKMKLEYTDETISEVPPLFRSCVLINGKKCGEGEANRKKEAQQLAAKAASDGIYGA